MEILVTELEPCIMSVHYTADAEQILNKRGEVLKAFKRAPVPGFRKNKVPVNAIKMHYKTQIEDSLKRALAEDSYHNTLFEKKLKPHGAPKFNSLLLTDDKFVCEFEIHTKPDFELVPYLNLEITKPHEVKNVVLLTEELLQNLRIRFGEASQYSETDFVQNGDNVIIDYQGSIDGVKIDSLTATGEMLTVGNSNLKQFDQNLLGMIMGETRSFDLNIPEMALPSFAGKIANIVVTLIMGSKIIPAALNDELAVKLGRKDFNDLRQFAHATAGANIQGEYTAALSAKISSNLIESNTIAVPNWMSLSEAQYLAHQAKVDWNTLPDEDKERYLEVAARNVKLSLILDKVREDNPEAQLTDQEVFNVIKQNIAKTQTVSSVDDVIQGMNKTGYLQILFARIKDEHAMQFIIKSAKVIE